MWTLKVEKVLTHIESFRARARLTPRSFGADLSEGGATLFSASLQINISHIHTVTSSPRIERYRKVLGPSTSYLEALKIARAIQHNRSSEPSVLQRGVDPEKKKSRSFSYKTPRRWSSKSIPDSRANIVTMRPPYSRPVSCFV